MYAKTAIGMLFLAIGLIVQAGPGVRAQQPTTPKDEGARLPPRKALGSVGEPQF